MGSVLILNPDNLSLANRLALEGHVVRVYGDVYNCESNPRRVSSLKLLDQYDFAIACSESISGDVARVGEECPVLGAGALNKQLRKEEYKIAVINELMQAKCGVGEVSAVQIQVNTWFDGNDFIYSGYILDYQRMCDGERGPITDGMGWVLWKASPADELLNTFMGLKKLLVDLEYIGPLLITYSITEQTVYVEDIWACFKPEMILWHEIIPKGLYEMFLSLKREADSINVLDDYAIGVDTMYITPPGIPFEPVYNIDNGAAKHFYDSIATARGQTIYEARKRVYRTLRTVCVDPELFYRSDIGSHVEESIGTLKQWGWLHA